MQSRSKAQNVAAAERPETRVLSMIVAEKLSGRGLLSGVGKAYRRALGILPWLDHTVAGSEDAVFLHPGF
jgi:hypothetical protein